MPQEHTAKSIEIGKFEPDFHQQFNPAKLDAIRHDTNRTVLGHGEFQKVLDAARQLAKSSHVLHEENGEIVHKPLIGKTTVTHIGSQTVKADAVHLARESDKWLKSFDEGGQRHDASRLQSTAADKVRDAKIEACQNFLASAQVAVAVHSPDMANVKLLQERVDRGDQGPATIKQLRETDAQVLATAYGKGGPGGGTSEVAIIKAPDKSVAYAFKSCAGESDQTGMAKGAGAIREVMAYEACKEIQRQTGIDFGWPETSIAKLSVGGGTAQPGALVDGLKGRVPASPETLGMGYHPDKHGGMTEDQAIADSKQRIDKLPDAEVQKLLVCNLMMAQYDIKWDNVFIEKAGDRHSQLPEGTLKARPFDGGAAFPDRDSLMDFGIKDPTPGQGLLLNCEKTDLPAANGKLSEELQRKVMDIDTGKLKAALTQVVDDSLKAGVAVAGNQRALREGALEGIDAAVTSIKGIQQIFEKNLQQGNPMTLQNFTDQYREQVYKAELVPQHEQAKWLGDKTQEYRELQQKNPQLLPKIPDNPSQTEQLNAWNNYVKPNEQAALEGIKKLGGPQAVQEHKIGVGTSSTLHDWKAASTQLKTLETRIEAAHPQQQQVQRGRGGH